MRGSIARLNKKIGCGFGPREDGFEAHFDLSSLEGINIRMLSIGEVVEYEEHVGHEQSWAARVRIVSNPRSKSAIGS